MHPLQRSLWYTKCVNVILGSINADYAFFVQYGKFQPAKFPSEMLLNFTYTPKITKKQDT